VDNSGIPQQIWLKLGIPVGFWYRHSQVRILPPQPAGKLADVSAFP
jgi:hypothetical protein